MGGNFANGKGNATLFLGYHKQQPVLQSQRDYSACTVASNPTGFTCAGSSTSFPGRFLDGNSGKSWTIADAAGNLRPFSSALDQFNFGPYNHYQAPDERWSADVFAHYDVIPQARVYGEFGFHDDHTPRNIAPSGAFFGQEYFLTADNPLLSTSFKNTFGITSTTPGDLILGRRDVEGGPRINDLRNTSYRGVIGVKGTILNGWDYDVYYQQAKVLYQEEYLNDFSKVHTQRALDVVAGPNGPVCRSFADGTDPLCVPWDIFHLGGVTPAAIAYLATPGLQRGFTEQSIYGGTLGADLGMYGWISPWAKDGIGVSFGAERRVDKLRIDTDVEFSSFDLAGQGGPVIGNSGKTEVRDIFAEVRVPIIQDKPGAQYLAVNGSYRYSDYDTGKTTNTFGFGAEWNPIKEVKLRASIQQAVRAPNVVELFLPQGLNLFTLNADPCGGPNGTSATLAQCQRTGLPANLYGNPLLSNPAGQYNFVQGGNPNLDPETGKSYTAGVVWIPMRNLSASVDYYKIKVSNVISSVAPSLALSQCLNVGLLCDLIHRDARGTLWLSGGGSVTATNINLARLETTGVDISANYIYTLPGAWGSIAASFLGTYLNTFKTDPGIGTGAYDCAGFYGNTCVNATTAAPLPKWRHKLRGTWSTPWNVDLTATWRHIDSVKIDSSSSDPQLNGAFNPPDGQLGERDYLDLALSWAITKQFTLWAGVQNVTDRDPPITSIGPTGPFNGNTYPQTYDALGRRIFVSLTAKF